MSSLSLLPNGLKSLVECISRATLLSQPADIPNFLLEYLLEVIDFRCSDVNYEAGDKDVSFLFQELWEEKFLMNMKGTTEFAGRQPFPVATTETSTPPEKRASLTEIEEYLKTLYSDYASCNEESVGKEIEAPDRKGFPDQPKAAVPLKPTPPKVKTHEVSFVSCPKDSGRTMDTTSETNCKPSPIPSHPRLMPPRCVVKQSEKMAPPPPSRERKPAPPPRDELTETRSVSSVSNGNTDMTETHRPTSKTIPASEQTGDCEPSAPSSHPKPWKDVRVKVEGVPERTSIRTLEHKTVGQLRSRAGPSTSSIPVPEGPTEPGVTPKVSVLESNRKRPITPKVSVPVSNQNGPTTPKVSVPESNQNGPTTPKVSVPESNRKRPTTPKVSIPENNRNGPRTPKVFVPESNRKCPTTPKVSVPEGNQNGPTTPKVSVPESNRKRPTTPKVSVPESTRKRPTTPKVSVPETNQKRPTTPKVSVPETNQKRPTTPKVSVPETNRTKDLNKHKSTRKRSATPKINLPEWTNTKDLNGPEKTRTPRVLWSEKAIARPGGGGQGATNLGQVNYSALTCPHSAHTVHIIRYKRLLPQSTTLGFSDPSGSAQHHSEQ
ncbi:proteoglycan 4-like isoform X3 [Etheostoma cragini]|uniref:proteoglycan 4-like isoform X3 n=1 Tax=Etheostoma cragini TaxID=417921 RepID=UPI00155E8211|nr:proteoglycan 4-like isoform X3 [Etheostoma cragini]